MSASWRNACTLVVGVAVSLTSAVACAERAGSPPTRAATAGPGPGGSEVGRDSEGVSDSEFIGLLIPNETVEIVAAVDGQLARLDVGLGDPVHPNQAIGMITPDLRSSEDGTSARNHVLVAELEHQAAAIAWNESRERLERLNALPDLVPGADRAAAQFDERAAATRVGIADALLGQRRAELRAQERIDSSAVLRSPIMGSVAAILSVQGATVTRGMPLVRIIGGRVLTLRFAAPAHRRNDLFIGAALSVKGQGFTETATLIRLSAEVDPLTQLIVGDASLDSPAPSSLAGTRAEVRVLNPLAAAR